MSARQAFIPRPPSRISSSEADACTRDGIKDTPVNGNGKARSVTALLGKKSGGGDTTSHAAGPLQGLRLGRTHANTQRRSFEGILRPQLTPMSIIPYPTTSHPGTGAKLPHGAGQTPRKITGAGGFDFPRPITPASMPRGLKKGFGTFAESRENEATSDGTGNGTALMEPEGETGARTGIGGYMRMYGESGNIGSADGLQASLGHHVAAPVPGYALGGLDANPEHEECEIGDIFARRPLRSLGTMVEEEVGPEENNNAQKCLVGAKRGVRREDVEGCGRYSDEGHHIQRPIKRAKQVRRDPDEYLPISSPHMPPTPRPRTGSVVTLDPSLVVSSLFESAEESANFEEIESDWKRWKECTTEEWLEGADALAQEYSDILNLVKDHLTEKVLAYANMMSSVEERQTEVKRNIEKTRGKWGIVRENISKLGRKK